MSSAKTKRDPSVERSGLDSARVHELRREHGSNVLPERRAQSRLARVAKLVAEPMILLLLITASLYLAMGDLEEGVLLAFSILVVLAISIYQEVKSERALEALRDLSAPRTLVLRDGEPRRLPASELVPDDVILLGEGDRVPADATLLESSHLSVDESLLTGESFSVAKKAGDPVYSSTLVLGGRGRARVTLTGARTEVGRIGQSLNEAPAAPLYLTREIRRMTRLFLLAGVAVTALIVVVYASRAGSWQEAALVGLATQMSLLPEEFPVVLTIFLALGAWRLSQVNVLVRQPQAIERLGAITALCVDKTGTLTMNRMSVARAAPAAGFDEAELLRLGLRASHTSLIDPMDRAIAERTGGPVPDASLTREYPLSERLLAMTCVWSDGQAATKGAPEAVLRLCGLADGPEHDAARALAAEGYRMLGVARAVAPASGLPETQEGFRFEWAGLLGFEDPIRPEVPDAVRRCREAGIEVIMMTGDARGTALKIASLAGIDATAVHARVRPEEKLRIVKELQAQGHVVAMTGDGVNDAPSLKWADVGIAMGSRGTDVAREASDIVLLDDHFASIVAGVFRGRGIFNNIRKAMGFIASVHVPIAGLAALPVLLGTPLVLLPAHIVFLELIIDPASSLMFEAQDPEDDLMRRRPRSLGVRLFGLRDLLRSFAEGTLVLAVCAFGYFEAQRRGASAEQVRTVGFSLLILCNLGLLLADLTAGSRRQLVAMARHPIVWGGILLDLGLLAAILAFEPARELFRLGRLDARAWALVLALATGTTMILGIWNLLAGRRRAKVLPYGKRVAAEPGRI